MIEDMRKDGHAIPHCHIYYRSNEKKLMDAWNFFANEKYLVISGVPSHTATWYVIGRDRIKMGTSSESCVKSGLC